MRFKSHQIPTHPRMSIIMRTHHSVLNAEQTSPRKTLKKHNVITRHKRSISRRTTHAHGPHMYVDESESSGDAETDSQFYLTRLNS